MGIYQELQLNQAGSKALIRASRDGKEKRRHTAVYLLKILITTVFCMAFVTLFTVIFGKENGIAGVAVLLSIMAFRQADLGIRASHGSWMILLIYGILIVGPYLTNRLSPGPAFAVNLLCILVISVTGCHNVLMFNHATFVLSYLLLQGYEVSGKAFWLRVAGLVLGGLATAWIQYHNHKERTYKRTIRDLLKEFNLNSTRTRWQIKMALGIASALLIADLLHIPRIMWVGVTMMSVLQPFPKEMKFRFRYRVTGNIIGGILVCLACMLLPKSQYSILGILGGLGVGFSATYLWQSIFNSFGAISVAIGLYGVAGAILLRIANNIFGVLYAYLFDKIYSKCLELWEMICSQRGPQGNAEA